MLKRAVMITLLLSGLSVDTFGQAQRKPIERALAWFAQLEEEDFAAYLQRVRLPKVSASFKAAVLARLDASQEITPSPRMLAMLSALKPVLQFHEREGVIEIRVIHLKHALVGFQGRAVLLVSDKIFGLLTAEELQAVVAHELGHEYFWGEYQEARQRRQHAVAHEIELRCDGIALITLAKLGLDPAHLASAIPRIHNFNRRVVTPDNFYHPALPERLQSIRALLALVKARNVVAPRLALK